MTQKWLLPIDGSELALKAVDWVIAHRSEWIAAPEVHLLNVQHPLSADIGRFINNEQLADFHREEGSKALAAAQARFQAAGIAATLHISVGDGAITIADFADAMNADQIVIGCHGRGGLSAALLGSVATKLAHVARIPLLLVR